MDFDIHVKPRHNREAIISQRLENSDETGEAIYDFRGKTIYPKVISLPIDIPVYRLENCRTFSRQQTIVARENLGKEYFLKGQENTEAQKKQHVILAELAKQGTETVTPIMKVLEEEGQREHILITKTGVVVNGNRRLSAMRELAGQSDGSVKLRFQHVNCAVLPSDTTRDEIDDIEADLQARPHTKLAYDWIGDAWLIRRQVDKGRSIKEVSVRLRRSKSEIENVLQALDEADLYLQEWICKSGEYDKVKEGQQIFSDIPKSIAGKNERLQNACRAIAWSLYEKRDKISGRVYRLNSSFGKLAPKVLEQLEERLEIEPDETTDSGDFAVDIEGNDTFKDYTPIIEALRNEQNKDESIDILIEACETAIELDKGVKNEVAALKALSQINSKITSIDVSYASQGTLSPMMKHIVTIRAGLNKIEDAITKRLKSTSDTT